MRGNPGECPCGRRRAGVYPRVCGGTGSIPTLGCKEIGLSPRMRGNPAGHAVPGSGNGSIPAYAGEPTPAFSPAAAAQVYPRVCGGTDLNSMRPYLVGGLSPRMRGNLRPAIHAMARPGSIPAYAGEPSAARRPSSVIRVYPRVCGGTV